MPTETVELMGLELSRLGRPALEDAVFAALGEGRGGRIVTVNLDILRACVADPEAAALVAGAELRVADGAPLVWAARLAGEAVRERVAGSDLIWTLSERAAREGRSVYLLGGRPGAARIAAERLAERCAGLRVAGHDCPPLGFERSPAVFAEVKARLAAARPDLVFVGLGFPKQDRVILGLREACPAAWHMGVGVGVEFVAGYVRRAPAWMQRTGLEWVYRLSREPRKLFGRYVIRDLPFVPRLFGWALRRRLAGPAQPNGGWWKSRTRRSEKGNDASPR